jgi:hypothetical protein
MELVFKVLGTLSVSIIRFDVMSDGAIDCMVYKVYQQKTDMVDRHIKHISLHFMEHTSQKLIRSISGVMYQLPYILRHF